MATLERRSSFLTLKQALLTDAAVSGAVGLLSLAGTRWLGSVLDLPAALLAGSGAFMTVYAVGLVMLGNRRPVPKPGVRIVVGGNLVWAAACLVLLFSGWLAPNALGAGFIVVQIMAVLIFAEVQVLALRASR